MSTYTDAELIARLDPVARVLDTHGLDNDAEAVREAARRLRAMAWQPISSAPRDGTEILAWHPHCGVLMIRWTAPINFATDRDCEEIGVEAAEQEDWFAADFCQGGRLEGSEVPTHWMPLPPPPTAGQGGGR